eukprot:CAMPEP_0171300180 /NCGR_PEP_ID=MMETSP0816-20121228/8977_1 /TAXON_ID=420281 /ORGANISM="Proboscia inermis, Strain CCAP1064/1" /LENGTH=61 /DNA_ID=CAMNT_0011776479 /DNA_START=738 /DNA_END=923 /DNA_ORIENTATION=-
MTGIVIRLHLPRAGILSPVVGSRWGFGHFPTMMGILGPAESQASSLKRDSPDSSWGSFGEG